MAVLCGATGSEADLADVGPASAAAVDLSQSLASLRHGPVRAKDRSASRRRGSASKRFAIRLVATRNLRLHGRHRLRRSRARGRSCGSGRARPRAPHPDPGRPSARQPDGNALVRLHAVARFHGERKNGRHGSGERDWRCHGQAGIAGRSELPAKPMTARARLHGKSGATGLTRPVCGSPSPGSGSCPGGDSRRGVLPPQRSPGSSPCAHPVR